MQSSPSDKIYGDIRFSLPTFGNLLRTYQICCIPLFFAALEKLQKLPNAHLNFEYDMQNLAEAHITLTIIATKKILSNALNY